jgi:phosphoglycerate dehydrogenase-like enzyme
VDLCGISTAHIDLDELTKRHITFSNVVHRGKVPVAEFFFAQLVRLARGVDNYQWKAQRHELMGKSIGIIGLGAVGESIAHLALAYKMDTSYYNSHRKSEWETRGLQYHDIASLLQSGEIVVVCSPTNIEILGEEGFKLMKVGSILVQASAGNVFAKTAFLNWVAEEGNYAILDKSAGEENYQLYKDLPRAIFSEDIAGNTYEANECRGQRVIANLHDYLNTATA